MKATGIIRRMDDLGRIVIPKEIRRNLRLREGDPMELFISDDHDGVEFRKYNPVSEPDYKRYIQILRAAAKMNNVELKFYFVDRDGLAIVPNVLPEHVRDFAAEAVESRAAKFTNVDPDERITAFRLDIDDDFVAALLIESANDAKTVAAVEMLGAMAIAMVQELNQC